MSDILPMSHPALQEARFKPGESGNPSGKPKGTYSVRAALRAQLAEGGLAGDMARDLLQAARMGDKDRVWCIATIIAEAEGKPKEHVEHSVATRYVVDLDDSSAAPPSLPVPPSRGALGGGVAPQASGSAPRDFRNGHPQATSTHAPLPLPGTPIHAPVERAGPIEGTPEVDP